LLQYGSQLIEKKKQNKEIEGERQRRERRGEVISLAAI
jgi:hypothetical protein